ncbi:hypothetical protein F2Q69_00014977 [Brassica cretica]|uniref:Uncharacterized protein n=1 Tax=Brassica cretica TaxID=69181 RepID=A0A8S9R8B7_BRACR|nr:hypothetical protein F2Q69_00014977 [Brassica cretica]
MHSQEHNNRLPFDFKRATERELCRLEENHRERSPRRGTGGDVTDERHRKRSRREESPKETSNLLSSKRAFEREREREKEMIERDA